MNMIILSGGSGKRLWPLSNDVRSKQFLKLFKDDNGNYESMAQRTYRLIGKINGDHRVIVAAPKMQVSELKNQLGSDINISIEPSRKDTFPAIVLAAYYLYYVLKVPLDEPVVVCPVDSYVEESFYSALYTLNSYVQNGDSNIYLLGIEPKKPTDKYGYIIPSNKEQLSDVLAFKEKPSIRDAQKYINDGGLWNAGVLAFKLQYIIDKAHELLDFTDYYDLLGKYSSLERISFDYAVLEHEKNMKVMRFSGIWEDLGTWNSLTRIMSDNLIGNVDTCGACDNLKIVNTLNLPILCSEVKDLIVVASQDGILISTPNENPAIKEYVEKNQIRAHYIEKSWGTFEIVDSSDNSLLIKLFLKANQKMSYHSHDKRDEIWNIISGDGIIVIDGKRKNVHRGETIFIKRKTKHTIISYTDMDIVEIQLGSHLEENDKNKYEIE